MKLHTKSVLRLVVFAMLVAALCVSLGCGAKEKTEPQTTTTDQSTTMGKAVDQAKEAAGDVAMLANPKPGIDPVCGMTIDDSRLVVEVDGKKYGFCAVACAEEFKADPAKYLAADATTEESHDH